jgi:subtilisin family serine protease
MRVRIVFLAFVSFLALALFSTSNVPLSAASDPRVSQQVWADLEQSGKADVLFVLGSSPDLSPAYHLDSKEARGRWVYETLRRQALQAQAPLVEILDREGVPFQRYWIVDAVQARLDRATLARVLAHTAVQGVVSDAQVPMEAPLPAAAAAVEPESMPWGVQRVEAPWAWSHGYTGAGVVISGQDTGYDWQHQALKRSYRGYNPVTGTADHNYNWHDSIHAHVPNANPDNPCGYNSLQPCDDGYHGTHTMGTMTGNDLAPSDPAWPAGAANAIGVAPGARWIGCRNMDNGVGRPSTYIECFEWLTAPYPLGGDPLTQGDPSRAPDIISNSWGCPPDEKCTPDQISSIEPALNAADAAGILVVVSAGNAGPSCSSVDDPPAIYPRSFAVGATASNDAIAGFSSRGVVTYQDKQVAKPDIAAPGVSVRSSVPGNNYGFLSGTSMASPHTAGVAALLLSAGPGLRGQTDLIKTILQRTAIPVPNYVCGASPGGVPNNVFGWGIVNARGAIESLSKPGSLKGAVTAAGSQPLSGAEVILRNDNGDTVASATTGADGSYRLQAPWGQYQVRVTRDGYDPATEEPVFLVGGQTMAQDFVLTPESATTHMQYFPLVKTVGGSVCQVGRLETTLWGHLFSVSLLPDGLVGTLPLLPWPDLATFELTGYTGPVHWTLLEPTRIDKEGGNSFTFTDVSSAQPFTLQVDTSCGRVTIIAAPDDPAVSAPAHQGMP